ncbi:PaaI family thioesterase [Blastomonas fulva]|uniref:PaaI family thioesterase n=1 Tax=Blastomonas fulva TaxID=1550728 RepID=UPI0025A36579|nr:PaaI family thioesterase [Blastomonas fulva]MDM7929842.1 PaaI family thioesterase [Blastomonas fulva]MDM7966803.1 PaaI family thioesterase [Blastomonas fulva]
MQLSPTIQIHVRKQSTQNPGCRQAAFAGFAPTKATLRSRAELLARDLGAVHGGYAATLLDSACGIAPHSMLGDGRGHTTLELKVSYLCGLTENSGTGRTTGRGVSVGSKVAFAGAELHDSEGRLCATTTSTLLVFDVEPRERGSLQA